MSCDIYLCWWNKCYMKQKRQKSWMHLSVFSVCHIANNPYNPVSSTQTGKTLFLMCNSHHLTKYSNNCIKACLEEINVYWGKNAGTDALSKKWPLRDCSGCQYLGAASHMSGTPYECFIHCILSFMLMWVLIYKAYTLLSKCVLTWTVHSIILCNYASSQNTAAVNFGANVRLNNL